MPKIHNGYNMRFSGSSSDHFNKVAIVVKTTVKSTSRLIESI